VSVSGIRLPELGASPLLPNGDHAESLQLVRPVRKASKKDVNSLRQESYTMKSLEIVKKLYDEVVRKRKRKRATPSRVLVYIQFSPRPGLRIDLPLKLIVWEDGAGKFEFRTTTQRYLTNCHGLLLASCWQNGSYHHTRFI
jgi:hypothetical protein